MVEVLVIETKVVGEPFKALEGEVYLLHGCNVTVHCDSEHEEMEETTEAISGETKQLKGNQKVILRQEVNCSHDSKKDLTDFI